MHGEDSWLPWPHRWRCRAGLARRTVAGVRRSSATRPAQPARGIDHTGAHRANRGTRARGPHVRPVGVQRGCRGRVPMHSISSSPAASRRRRWRALPGSPATAASTSCSPISCTTAGCCGRWTSPGWQRHTASWASRRTTRRRAPGRRTVAAVCRVCAQPARLPGVPRQPASEGTAPLTQARTGAAIDTM